MVRRRLPGHALPCGSLSQYLRPSWHAEDIITRLCVARDSSEPDTLSREAHGAKGMLSLMACTGLARLANQIERQPTETSARARTDELIDGLRKLRETLRSRSDLSPDGQAETQTRDQD